MDASRKGTKIATKKPREKLSPEAILYSRKLTDPNAWIAKANELLTAAQVLEKEVVECWRVSRQAQEESLPLPVSPNPLPAVHGAYFMLVAYALENLCKAHLVSTTIERNSLVTYLPNGIKKNHDLLSFVKDIGLKISLKDEDLLKRLSRNIIWAARYPVPIDSSEQVNMSQFSNGKFYLIAYLSEADVAGINDLIARVKIKIGVT